MRERLAAYVPKALREAKRHTKWIEPNERYEKATVDLLDRMLSAGSRFIAAIRPVLQDLAHRGMLISLARTILKCTVPGVPDFYQGTTLYDFSLVDPDNRRPVDYGERTAILDRDERLATLLGQWQNGAIKLRVAATLLQDRRKHPTFYGGANYEALTVTGAKWTRLVAFARRQGTMMLVVLVPRLAGSGSAKAAMPVGETYWGSTTVDMPAGTWRDLFEDRVHEVRGSMAVGKLLDTLPFAVLRMDV